MSQARDKTRRRTLPFEVTRAGQIFLLMTFFVVIATLNSGVNVLYFAMGIMGGMFLASMAVASWSLRKIRITRDFGGHVIAGEAVDCVYTLVNGKRHMPAMSLAFREKNAGLLEEGSGYVAHLAARGEGRATARIAARRRGLLALDEMELSTTFPFGLVRWVSRVRVPAEMVVYPRIGMLNRRLALEYRESVESGAMTSNRRGGNDEFYGVREYRPGDNVRAIHWRSSARTGQLMIREMAANAPPQLIVVLNLRGRRADDSDDLVERAIELAAGLICFGYFENFAVGLGIAGTDGEAPMPSMGRDSRGQLLEKLAVLDVTAVDKGKGVGFPNQLAGRAQWVVVTLHEGDVVADLLPLGDRGRSAGARGGGGGGVRTVLAVDGEGATGVAGGWLHFMTPADTMRLLREQGAG